MWTRSNEIERMLGAMDHLRSRMNRVFTDVDSGYADDFGFRSVSSTPKTNLYDDGDKLQLIAELPGLKKDDISVQIQGNYLQLSGSRKSQVPEGYKAHRIERAETTFTRSFTLPSDIDIERVEAELKDGILTLVLPKAEEAKPKQIVIS